MWIRFFSHVILFITMMTRFSIPSLFWLPFILYIRLARPCISSSQSLDAHQVSKKLEGHEGLNLSLRDIQLALATSKYPEDKAFKLYERLKEWQGGR